jgi:hypothetical protein
MWADVGWLAGSLWAQLEEAGAVSCLIKLLKSGHDDDVLEQSALALTRFAVDLEMRKHIADGGGITALTDLVNKKKRAEPATNLQFGYSV